MFADLHHTQPPTTMLNWNILLHGIASIKALFPLLHPPKPRPQATLQWVWPAPRKGRSSKHCHATAICDPCLLSILAGHFLPKLGPSHPAWNYKKDPVLQSMGPRAEGFATAELRTTAQLLEEMKL